MNRSLKFLNLYGNCEVIKMEYQNMTNEMTNEQIKRRIEWIDRELFYIDMKDRWDACDWSLVREYEKEKRELQAILEARIEK